MRSHNLPRTPQAPGVTQRYVRTMSAGQRLQASIPGAAPWTQLTPAQNYFRNSLGTGQLALPSNEVADSNLYQHKRHPDGTVDNIRLEPSIHVYLDLGGKGGRDTCVGRA